ncbi:MAG: hypothetical protein ACRD34_02340 [Bryobacteraceae bacterium]
MTVTLTLRPEIEAGLLARAQASGTTVEEYLRSMIEEAIPKASNPLTPKERAAAFRAWSASHDPTPPLSDFAVSREAMYGDRDP